MTENIAKHVEQVANENAVQEMNGPDRRFEVGTTYVFNIPPSWILVGTVKEADDTHIILKDAIYSETLGEGHSALGSIPNAASAKELKEVCSRCYPIRDGMILRQDAILIAIPCVKDMSSLARQNDANAIKKAAGR